MFEAWLLAIVICSMSNDSYFLLEDVRMLHCLSDVFENLRVVSHNCFITSKKFVKS